MPSSSASPLLLRNTACAACRGFASTPRTFSAMAGTAGPLSRTMPIPPRPGGVASAAIVSRLTSSLGMGRLVAVEHALDLPLLGDGKDVVDQPVEHQAGREEKEKDAEDEGHDLHHPRLHRIGR